MATFKLISSESVELTPDLARAHRDMPGSPTERKLDPTRVSFLKGKATAGLFLPPSWATVNFNERELRMNGQHSSTALCETDDFPEGLKVHLDKYEADTEDDMVMLFRQFDARQSSRSLTDISGAFMGLKENLRSVDVNLGLQCVKAISWYHRMVECAAAPTGENVGELFNQEMHHPFILWMNGLEWSKGRELKQVPVMAAMYGSFEINKTVAKEFWEAVMLRRHQFDEEHPATTLENYLMAVMKKEEPFRNGKKPKPAQVYESCVESWNAYRQEKTITFKLLQKVDPKKKGFSEIAA